MDDRCRTTEACQNPAGCRTEGVCQRATPPRPVQASGVALTKDAQDAARYRWLRDHAGMVCAGDMIWESAGEEGDENDGKSLDAAIDELMPPPGKAPTS